ncbi:hypothetical protein [Sorangium sp. So ce124]|uniref:hypothetical protein n=1 Tax=Sorangium sp. So ce124 TaxID=3133280 RepID=UPI003F63B64D
MMQSNTTPTQFSVRLRLVENQSPANEIPQAAIFDDSYLDHWLVLDQTMPLVSPGPEIPVILEPGTHRLDPGHLVFDVYPDPDGNVQLHPKTPGLSADGDCLTVLMTPLTLETRDGESGRRRVPGLLQISLETTDEPRFTFERPWNNKPLSPSFATIYIPTGHSADPTSPTPLDLSLQPQGARLQLSASKVEISEDATRSLSTHGLAVTVTMTPFRFTLQHAGNHDGRGTSIILGGTLNQSHSSSNQTLISCDYKWLLPATTRPPIVAIQQNAQEGGALRVEDQTPLCPPLPLISDGTSYSLLVSRLDERCDGAHTLLAGVPRLKYEAGDSIDFVYAYPKGTLPSQECGDDAQLAVLLRPEISSTRKAPDWWPLTPSSVVGDPQGLRKVTVTLPSDLRTDRYRLRLAMVHQGSTSEDSRIFRDFVIGVVNRRKVAVTALFLPAKRWSYVAGEEIEVQCTVQSTRPEAGQTPRGSVEGLLCLRIRGENLDARLQACLVQELASDGARHAQGWVLSGALTSALKPGEYALTVVFTDKSGDVVDESCPQYVTLTSAVRRTLFPGIIDCYGNDWLNSSWLNWLPEVDQANRMMAYGARRILGVGADVLRFDGWWQTLTTGGPYPCESETEEGGALDRPVLPDDDDLPPVEVTAGPRMLWRAFDHALPYGTALLPSLCPGDTPRIETKLDGLLAEQRRFVRLQTQYLRRYPNFAGTSYSHWSGATYTGYVGGTTNAPPPEVVTATRTAIWRDFCETCGFQDALDDPPPDTPDGQNWVSIGTPTGGAATPTNNKDLWRSWVLYTNKLLPSVHGDWGSAAGEICQRLVSTDARGAPGFFAGPRSAYDAYIPGNHYLSTQGLNLIEAVTNDDWGIEPYSLELMADIFGFGWRQRKPVWVGGWAHKGVAQSEYMREAIETLARGALPALYGGSLAPVFASRANDDWMHQDWGRRQATERVFQMTTAYGEWAWSFAVEKPIAILASFTQSAMGELRSGYARVSRHGASIYEAYVACLLAGYSPTFVYEEEIVGAGPTAPGVLSGFKAVLLVDITEPLPDKVVAALRTFAGSVFVDKPSEVLQLPFATCLAKPDNVTFDAYWTYEADKDPDGQTEFSLEMNSSEYSSGYWWHMRRAAEGHRKTLVDALDGIARPFAQTERSGILLSTGSLGERCKLIYAVNDTPLPYEYSVEMPRPYAYMHQCWTSPLAEVRVTIHAEKGVLYDALQMCPVDLSHTEGELSFTASFAQLSGTLYAFLPRPIEEVVIECGASEGAISLYASVVDKGGEQIPAPLEIVVTDAAGVERYHIYRAAGLNGWREQLPVALNDTAAVDGSSWWTITVRELLSGQSRTCSIFHVTPPPWGAVSGTSAARPLIIVTDRAALAELFKSRRPLTIALDRRQDRDTLTKLAHDLAAWLSNAGQPTKCCWLDQLPRGQVTYSKLLWSGSALLPDEPVEGALILLGRPEENELLAQLARAGVLLREASASYPGGDGAVIAHVWSAFSGDNPVLAVLAASDDGLANAVRHITGGGYYYDPVPSLESARAQMMPPLFRATWAGRALEPSPVASATRSTLRPLDGAPHRSSRPVIHPAGDTIRALAVSDDGRVYAAGTDSGRAIRVDAVSGAVKAVMIPQNGRFVQQIALTPDGEYTVVASTQPPAVFVLNAAGDVRWYKTDVPFDWGSDPRSTLQGIPARDRVRMRHYDPEYFVHDEPDYFALAPSGKVVVRESRQRLVCYGTEDGKQLWERSYSLISPGGGVFRDAHRLRFAGDERLAVSVVSYDVDAGWLDRGGHSLLLLDGGGKLSAQAAARTVPAFVTAPRGSIYPAFVVPGQSPRQDLDQRRLVLQPRVLGYHLAVSSNGSCVVASDEFGNHNVYDECLEFSASYAIPGRPCLSPDGKLLAVYRDGVTVVELATRKHWILTLDGEEEVSDVAWSADSQRLAVARWDGLVQVLTAVGKVLGTVRQPSGVGAVLLAVPDRGGKIPGGWLAGTSHGHLLEISAKGELVRQPL